MRKKPNFTRQHFEFIADFFGPMMSPSDAATVADVLEDTNPNFKRNRFEDRFVSAWENAHADAIEEDINTSHDIEERSIKYVTAI